MLRLKMHSLRIMMPTLIQDDKQCPQKSTLFFIITSNYNTCFTSTIIPHKLNTRENMQEFINLENCLGGKATKFFTWDCQWFNQFL